MTIAIAFSEYGDPDVLEPIEIDEHAGPGQIRVRVRAAGVQPFDCAIRRGVYAKWMPVRFPCRLGNEFAGVVDQVGDGVTGLAVGDEVIGFEQMRCHAEAVVVDADHVVAKPAGMPWPQAGALSASGQTAHTALRQLGVGPGDVLLVHAAAGGVGGFAVQLAVEWGATVIGTASERNHEYLRSLGAIPVTYGPGLADRVRRAAPNGVDVVLDAVGGAALEVSTELVADRFRIGTVADQMGARALGVRAIGTERGADRLGELVDLYTKGRLRVTIARTVPLREAPVAHREVEAGHVRGKVVLTND